VSNTFIPDFALPELPGENVAAFDRITGRGLYFEMFMPGNQEERVRDFAPHADRRLAQARVGSYGIVRSPQTFPVTRYVKATPYDSSAAIAAARASQPPNEKFCIGGESAPALGDGASGDVSNERGTE